MKKLIIILTIVALLVMTMALVATCTNTAIDPYMNNSSPLKIEKAKWYVDDVSNDTPWFYLEITVTNTGDKDIKAIKSCLGADLFWYDENGRLGGIHTGDNSDYSIKRSWAITVQVDWPINDRLKAGQTQIYSIPFHSVSYGFGGTTYNIYSLVYSDVVPYWISFSGFGDSWGRKNFDILTDRYANNLIFYNAVRIPDFNPVVSS